MNNKYQTGLRRFAAAIIDGLIFVPFVFFDSYLSNTTYNIYIDIIWTIFVTLTPIFYSVFFHYYYGRTVGKALTGIKVFDISETRLLTLKQAILRDSVIIIIELAALAYFINDILFHPEVVSYRHSINSDITDIPYTIWIILELVTMLTNDKRRAIHDFLAKSVVIKTS